MHDPYPKTLTTCLPIILVPHKRPTSVRLLHHKFGVIMVHLSPQQLLHSPRHLLATPHHPCEVVTRVIPQTHRAPPAMTIITRIRML